MWQELSCNTVIWETSSNFRIWYDFSIKKAGTGEELKVSLERWVTLFKIQLVNRNCRKQVFGIWDPHGFGWVLALQTPTNVSSPTSLGRWVSSQRSGEVTFPQLFVAREQSLPFLRIPFPGRSSGILSTSFRREAFSKGFLIPSELLSIDLTDSYVNKCTGSAKVRLPTLYLHAPNFLSCTIKGFNLYTDLDLK